LLLSSLRRKGNDLLAIRGLEQSCVSYSIKVQSYHVNHWQKINQYKWKCWENIFIGKTDGNIPLLFTERISREKKLKQKKNDYVPFPPTLDFLAPGFFHRGKYKVSSFLYIPISYIFSYRRTCFPVLFEDKDVSYRRKPIGILVVLHSHDSMYGSLVRRTEFMRCCRAVLRSQRRTSALMNRIVLMKMACVETVK
jgi:hypothetical protein